MTNTERARRARATLDAYISYTGDNPRANDTKTWVSDLMCDLRHMADAEGFRITPDMGLTNYEAEVQESCETAWQALQDIANANSNSEPDAMGVALDKAIALANEALKEITL